MTNQLPAAPRQYYPPGYYPPPGLRPPPVKMVMTVGGQPLADPLDRFLAYLIDSLILAAVLLVPYIGFLFYVFNVAADQARRSLDNPTFSVGPLYTVFIVSMVLVLVVQLVASYVYYVPIQLRRGQTVGKRVMKIAVVRQADGGPLDARLARRRWLTQSPGGILPGFNYANMLWLLWDEPFRQCLHDKTAGTVVVKVSPPVKVGP